MAMPPINSDPRPDDPRPIPALPALPAINGLPPGAVPLANLAGHGPGAAPAAAFDTQALVNAFRRRWLPAVALGLLMAASVGVTTWCVIPPAQYVSRTTLMITTYLPKIIFETAETRADFQTYQRTQIALIKSRFILAAVLRDPKVATLPTVRQQEEPLEWLEKALKIEFSGQSELLELSLMGDHAADLAVLLDTVTDTYMRLVVEEEHRGRLNRLDQLRKLWNRYQDELKAKRGSLRSLAEAGGSTDRATLALKQQLALENVAIAQQAQMALRPEMLKLESDIKYLESKKEGAEVRAFVAPGSPSAVATSTPWDADPEIKALKAQIEKLSGKLRDTQRLVRNNLSDPSVIPLRHGLETARRALVARQAQLAQARVGEGTATPLSMNPLAQAKERLQILKLYEGALTEDVERYRTEAKSVNLNTLDLQSEQDEIALANETAKKIGTEVESLDVELQAPPRIKVIDRAKVPGRKDEMKRIKMTGAAGIGALAIGLLGVTLMEIRARRISSADEVVRGLPLRLVGTLPDPTGRRGGRLAALTSRAREDHSRSRLIESIDATRTMLLHASRVESTRIVMVTSAMKGEGKTTLSGHLATSLARAGRRTLLIDCDFRRPSVHRLFDLPQEPGVSELLRGEVGFGEAIRPSPAGDLDVIAAGRWDGRALQALARDGCRPLFNRLAEDYDFLIIDSAPVLQVTDTLLLGQQVDAVIFSILRDVSCVPQVQAAYERLEVLGIRMLGAVVNGEDSNVYSYSKDYAAGAGA